MSARVFVLCLLSSIISTAASLKCQACFASREECKNEDMELVKCGSDERYCLSFSFLSTMITPPVSTTFKSCATVDQCSEGYYGVTSLASKYKQMRIACCETDGCNTGPLPIPRHDRLKTNRLVCPGSYEQNGHSEESGPVFCLEDEDQCLSSTFSIHALSAFNSTVSAQGCATRTLCAYPEGETELAHGLLRVNVEKLECQDAARLEGWNGF